LAARSRAEDGRENEHSCRLLQEGENFVVFDQNTDGEVGMFAATNRQGQTILLMD
jgi:hypothetical protein